MPTLKVLLKWSEINCLACGAGPEDSCVSSGGRVTDTHTYRIHVARSKGRCACWRCEKVVAAFELATSLSKKP